MSYPATESPISRAMGALRIAALERPMWLILPPVIIAAAAFQGSRGLYETTEGRYAECARQTLHSGDLLEPVLNGSPHWTKPPLTYWMVDLGYIALGETTWGARAYVAAAFVLTVLAVYFLAVQLWGRGRAAAMSALCYATFPFTLVASNIVSADTLLTLFEVLSLACFWWAVNSGKRLAMACMWAALGLAFFTKGPVGLMPLIGIVPAYLLVRRRGPELPRLLTFAGVGVFALTGLSWYLIEIVRHPGLLKYWVGHEVVGRTIRGDFQRNPQFYKAFTMYLPALAWGTAPWTLLLAVKFRSLKRPEAKALNPLDWEQGIQWTFLLCSVVPPLVLFFLAKSKLTFYILPVFAPMAVMFGKVIGDLVGRGKLRPMVPALLAIAVCIGFIAAKATVAAFPDDRDMHRLAESVAPVLDDYPRRRLFVFGARDLNGLQFYTGERVESVTLEDLPAIFEHDSAPEGAPLVLVRDENVQYCLEALAGSSVEARPLDENWSVIAPMV